MVRLGDRGLDNRSRGSYAARATVNIMLKNETSDIKGDYCSIHWVCPHGIWDITTGPTVSPPPSTTSVSGIPALPQDLGGTRRPDRDHVPRKRRERAEHAPWRSVGRGAAATWRAEIWLSSSSCPPVFPLPPSTKKLQSPILAILTF